jgi:GlpG protein
MTNNRPKLKITFNSPAILVFALACVAVQVVNVLTHGASNRLLFSTYRSSLLSPLTWVRCVTHVLGHADWGHLLNNMMLLLILGPMLEEKYGTKNLVFVMLATAIATAVVNMVFFPNVALLGASGVVFAMVLLSSITSTDGHTIPLTFILVAVLYIGQQVYEGLFVADNISQLGHIVGGLVGTVLGFVMNRNNMSRYQR